MPTLDLSMFDAPPNKPAGELDFSMFGSVADVARARLASRGLTPEDVKAGRGLTTPDQIKFDDPARVNGGYLGGLVGSLKPDIAEIAANGILPAGGPFVVRSWRAAANLANHHNAVDVTSAALKTAGLPDYAGIARESYHRGEANQSRADMYGAATPPVALAAAGMAAKMLPEGAISETAGHASYGKIFGPDADPAAVDAVVPQLVAERRIVGNVDDLAQHGARIEQVAKDAAPAGRLVARPPGSDAPPVLHAADGTPLVEAAHVPGPDEQFGSTLRTLAENAPQPNGGTVGGLVSAGVGYIAHKLLPGNWFIPGAAEAVGAAKLGKAVFTSPLFRTTLGVVKNSFANALRTGDTTAALGIAAKIAGGQNLDDQFGHDRAVYGAVDNAYAQANGKASVARQILHGQEAVYVNPDGSEVAVPGHVTRSFINAIPSINLQHSDSGMAPSDAQGGAAQVGRQAGVPAAELSQADARERFRASHRPDAEWPSDPKGNNENDALFLKTPPQKLLPPQFKNARDVNVASPISGKLADDPEAYAEYGVDFPSGRADSVRAGRDYPNNMLIARKAEGLTDIVPHEVAHAIYAKDLTPQQRAAWNAHHASELKKLGDDMRAAGVTSANDPRFHAVLEQLRPKYLRAIVNYANAPYESFAEAAGQYQANPAAFKAAHPQDYKIISDMFGRVEYIGGHVLPPPRDDAAR